MGVDIFTPDFLGLGRAFGCATARPETLMELKRVLAEASLRDSPTVVEIEERKFVDGYPFP